VQAPAFSTPPSAEDRERLGRLREKLSTSPENALADLEELARTQPEKAIGFAYDLGRTDEEKAAWVQAILKPWADRNPGQAWNWVVRPGNRLANNSLLTVVIDSMAASDPEMLVGKITGAIVVDDKSGSLLAAPNIISLGLLAMVRSGKVERAKAAVEAWANDPGKPKIGEVAYDIVAMGLDQKEPANIGAWLRSLPASQDRNAAIASLAYNWGTRDPVAAMHWAQTLTPQQDQPNAVSRVFGEWVQSDPTQAIPWLKNYLARTPNSVARDAMIGSLVLFSPLAKNNPGAAAKLADSITNPEARFTYQQQIFQAWGRSDAPTAIQYVQHSPTISPDRKKLLIQEIQEASLPNPPDQ